MNREEYNACISKGMRGKQFTKEERKLEFCTLAKLCSGKVETREEAMRICSLPKEPKSPSTKRKARKLDSNALAACVIKSLGSEVTLADLTTIIANCTGQRVEKPLTRERFIKKCFRENQITGDIKEAQKLRSFCTAKWKEQETSL